MKQADNKRTKNGSTLKSFFLLRNNQNYDKDIQSQLKQNQELTKLQQQNKHLK